MEGNGKYFYENNEYYIGEWKNNLRHGRGTLYFQNGVIKFDGQFYNDNQTQSNYPGNNQIAIPYQTFPNPFYNNFPSNNSAHNNFLIFNYNMKNNNMNNNIFYPFYVNNNDRYGNNFTIINYNY